MTKAIRILCATGLLATMLVSPTLWSQDDIKESSGANPEDAQPSTNKEPSIPKEEKPAGDFKPSEEISEDFPVPLPSDI
jgi:hypothetical protein